MSNSQISCPQKIMFKKNRDFEGQGAEPSKPKALANILSLLSSAWMKPKFGWTSQWAAGAWTSFRMFCDDFGCVGKSESSQQSRSWWLVDWRNTWQPMAAHKYEFIRVPYEHINVVVRNSLTTNIFRLLGLLGAWSLYICASSSWSTPNSPGRCFQTSTCRPFCYPCHPFPALRVPIQTTGGLELDELAGPTPKIPKSWHSPPGDGPFSNPGRSKACKGQPGQPSPLVLHNLIVDPGTNRRDLTTTG